MKNCKFCKSNSLVKYGFYNGNQKYKCKNCCKVMQKGDKRIKYSNAKRNRVIRMYLENVGIRSIERIENVSSTLIIKWIRKYSQIIQDSIESFEVPQNKEDIEILEIDELCTFIKKNQKMAEEMYLYGLLWIGEHRKLLILK